MLCTTAINTCNTIRTQTGAGQTLRSNFTKFSILVSGRDSLPVGLYCNTLPTSGFLDDTIYIYNRMIVHAEQVTEQVIRRAVSNAFARK